MRILWDLVGLGINFEYLIFVQRQVFLQKKNKDLENTKEMIAKFERRISKKTRKVGYSGKKGLYKRIVTKKVYSEDIV